MNIKILNNIFEAVTILVIIIFIIEIILKIKKNNIEKEEKSLAKINLKTRLLQKISLYLKLDNIIKLKNIFM